MAILLRELDATSISVKIENSPQRRISAVTYTELQIVSTTKIPKLAFNVGRRLIEDLEIEVIPLSREQADLAARAYDRFGKGIHPASLNFGDCFAYALAKALDAPLLFKGTDFGRTDVQAVDIGAA